MLLPLVTSCEMRYCIGIQDTPDFFVVCMYTFMHDAGSPTNFHLPVLLAELPPPDWSVLPLLPLSASKEEHIPHNGIEKTYNKAY